MSWCETAREQCKGFCPRKRYPASTWAAFESLTQETSVALTGTVREEPRSPGGYELGIQDVEVLGSSHDYPITPKEHGTTFLFEHRHLWLRSRRQAAVARVRHEVVQAIRDFFYERDFVLVDTPILTGAIGEEAGNLFATEYFDLGNAYLAQTGQLYVEAAAAAHGKVYCFGPTFQRRKIQDQAAPDGILDGRARGSVQRFRCKHAAPGRVCELIVGRALERRSEELKELERDTAPLERVQAPFPRISYTDAVARLNALGSDITWGSDLGGDDETLLAQ